MKEIGNYFSLKIITKHDPKIRQFSSSRIIVVCALIKGDDNMRKRILIVSIFSILLIITVMASNYIGVPVTSEEQAVEIANKYVEKQGFNLKEMEEAYTIKVSLNIEDKTWNVSYIPKDLFADKIENPDSQYPPVICGGGYTVIVIKMNNSKNVRRIISI